MHLQQNKPAPQGPQSPVKPATPATPPSTLPATPPKVTPRIGGSAPATASAPAPAPLPKSTTTPVSAPAKLPTAAPVKLTAPAVPLKTAAAPATKPAGTTPPAAQAKPASAAAGNPATPPSVYRPTTSVVNTKPSAQRFWMVMGGIVLILAFLSAGAWFCYYQGRLDADPHALAQIEELTTKVDVLTGENNGLKKEKKGHEAELKKAKDEQQAAAKKVQTTATDSEKTSQENKMLTDQVTDLNAKLLENQDWLSQAQGEAKAAKDALAAVPAQGSAPANLQQPSVPPTVGGSGAPLNPPPKTAAAPATGSNVQRMIPAGPNSKGPGTGYSSSRAVSGTSIQRTESPTHLGPLPPQMESAVVNDPILNGFRTGELEYHVRTPGAKSFFQMKDQDQKYTPSELKMYILKKGYKLPPTSHSGTVYEWND